MRISSRAVGAALAMAVAMTASAAGAERLSFDLQVRELAEKLAGNDFKSCKSLNPRLMKLIGDAQFPSLAPRTQAYAYFAAIGCAPDGGPQAVTAARSLVKLPVDAKLTYFGHSTLLLDAQKRDATGDYLAELHAIIADDPTALEDWEPRHFSWILTEVKDDPVQEAALLDDLHAVPWTHRAMREMDKNGWAVRRARRFVEAGDTPKARALLNGVTSPDSLMEVYQDRRFAPLWPELEADGRFDWVKLVEAALADKEAWMKAEPNTLEPVSEAIGSLRALKRYDEAVALGEAYAARLRKDETFTDGKDQRSWILNNLAYAYFDLGRFDEADKVVVEAMGEDLVSQAINRGVMLNNAGRPDQALKAVEKVPPGQSSKYGLMWLDSTRACAHAQLGNKAAAEALLDSMRPRWKDNASAVSRTLLCLDAQDEAAALYVKRLDDPTERARVLSAFRTSVPAPVVSPNGKLIEARGEAVRARPEVAAALRKWGRPLTLPLSGDL